MQMDRSFYFDQLYPLQDDALKIISHAGTGFYLTGGTVVSRVDLKHRFSDDLDLFVNWNTNYGDWCSQIIENLQREPQWALNISMRQPYFTRLFLDRSGISLKIELINDVLAHIGEIRNHPEFGRIDSREKILANKLTALIGRDEPRDLSDIWGLCSKLGLSIKGAIGGAQSKSSGIHPIDLAHKLCTVTPKQWEQVRWIELPDRDQYIAELFKLGEDLILV